MSDNALFSPAKEIIAIDVETGQRQRVTVSSNIIGRYPESNYQYLAYLNRLKDRGDTIAYANALPQRDYLAGMGLREDEIQFFTNEYLFNETYEKYPIVGLTYDQLWNYFQWKTDDLGFAYLEFEGLYKRDTDDWPAFTECLASIERKRILITACRIPTQAEILSGAKTVDKRSITRRGAYDSALIRWIRNNEAYNHLSVSSLDDDEVSNAILEKYDLHPSKYYDLTKAQKLRNTQGGFSASFTDLEMEETLHEEHGRKVMSVEVKGLLSVTIGPSGSVSVSSGTLLAPVWHVSTYFEDR
ncbi:MAG: hypothetical protein AAFP77_12035 [Bacteroidota bacterium]